jgi:iron complex transport system permease protein
MKIANEKTTIERRPVKRSVKGSRTLPSVLVLCSLSVLLFVVILISVSFGSTAIPIGTIAQILLNSTGVIHFTRHWDPTTELIIWQVRMPVVIGTALVGAALAAAGVLFQGMLRNPLADPYLMGTSSGAALGAAIAFVLPFDTVYGSFFSLTPLLAFVGAMLTVLFVYSIARSDGHTPIVTLLLAGVVINAVLVALQTLILTISPHSQFGLQALFNWLSGGVSATSWPPIFVVGTIILVSIAFSLTLTRSLDAFALGEEGAAHLGLNVERRKFVIIVVGSLLTAAAVSISGLIGFVGLVTPHVMRLLLGPRHRLLLPSAALGGAIFLTLADLLARVVIAPSVLPVGIFSEAVSETTNGNYGNSLEHVYNAAHACCRWCHFWLWTRAAAV